MLDEKKTELFKVGTDETSSKLRYLFLLSNDGDWKKKYRVVCSIRGIVPIEQGDLSDYEYFLLTHPAVSDEGNSHYYLLIDGEPATYVTLTYSSSGFVDITYSTSKKFCLL